MKISLFVFCLTLSLAGCCERQPVSETASAVARHYSGEAQKQDAAKYLFRYMPWHCHYDGNGIERYYDSVAAILDTLDDAGQFSALLSEATSHADLEILPDVGSIDAESIIRDIDCSFELWNTSPWAQHLVFDEFCEYILPYSCLNPQPLTDWKTSLKEIFADEHIRYLESFSREYNNDPRAAAEYIVGSLNREEPVFAPSLQGKVYDPELLLRMPARSCMESCIALLQILRSIGIPCALDYTPLWGDRGSGHYWLSLPDKHHLNVPFSPLRFADEQISQPGRIMSKVYRISFKPDDELARRVRKGWKVPKSIGGICIRDVSSEYMPSNDVRTPLFRGYKSGNLYLATFNNTDWVPVAYGRKCLFGTHARFRDIGSNVLYLPVCCDDYGRCHPVGDPFYIDLKGSVVRCCCCEDAGKDTVVMSRKYPVMKNIWKVEEFLHGGKLASLTIPDALSGEIPAGMKVRSLRLAGTVGDRTDIAELIFFDDSGNPVIPDSVTGDSINLIDGDALTYSSVGDGYDDVEIDFGRDVVIDRIRYFRRSDGNDVFPGYSYTLYYWHDRGWCKIEKKEAGVSPELVFENVPEGSVLLLKCDDTGKENRPFLWNNGDIIWF